MEQSTKALLDSIRKRRDTFQAILDACDNFEKQSPIYWWFKGAAELADSILGEAKNIEAWGIFEREAEKFLPPEKTVSLKPDEPWD